jgi:hypothetical protein
LHIRITLNMCQLRQSRVHKNKGVNFLYRVKLISERKRFNLTLKRKMKLFRQIIYLQMQHFTTWQKLQ